MEVQTGEPVCGPSSPAEAAKDSGATVTCAGELPPGRPRRAVGHTPCPIQPSGTLRPVGAAPGGHWQPCGCQVSTHVGDPEAPDSWLWISMRSTTNFREESKFPESIRSALAFSCCLWGQGWVCGWGRTVESFGHRAPAFRFLLSWSKLLLLDAKVVI